MWTASSALWRKAFLWCAQTSFEHWEAVRSVSIGLLCHCTAYKSRLLWGWVVLCGGVLICSSQSISEPRLRRYLPTGPPRPPGSSFPHSWWSSHMLLQGRQLHTRRSCVAQPTSVSAPKQERGREFSGVFSGGLSEPMCHVRVKIECMNPSRSERV